MPAIYRLLNTKRNKCYVGQTWQRPEERWAAHKSLLVNKHHHNEKLQHSFNKHGLDVWLCEVLWEGDCDQHLLDKLEIAWTTKLNSWKNGYNTNEGGRGGVFKNLWRNHQPKIALCVNCGKTFNDFSMSGAIYCSSDCKSKALYPRDRHIAIGSLLTVLCVHCNKEFTYTYIRSVPRKYCTKKCRKAAGRAKAGALPRGTPVSTICKICNCNFTYQYLAGVTRMYCSNRCRYKKPGLPVMGTIQTVRCAYCKVEFSFTYSGQYNRIYCSSKCCKRVAYEREKLAKHALRMNSN